MCVISINSHSFASFTNFSVFFTKVLEFLKLEFLAKYLMSVLKEF